MRSKIDWTDVNDPFDKMAVAIWEQSDLFAEEAIRSLDLDPPESEDWDDLRTTLHLAMTELDPELTDTFEDDPEGYMKEIGYEQDDD